MMRSSLLTSIGCWLRQRSLRIRDWDDLARHERIRGASIAVVGNAGYLADLEQGSHIDSHDLVLRMNNFRLEGLEKQVGRRTDIFMSTFYRDVVPDRRLLADVSLIVTSVPNNLRKRGLNWRHGQALTQGLEQLGRREMFAPTFDQFEAKRRAIGKYPTTGAMALWLIAEHLLPVCGNVYVTGFSFFAGRSHYFSSEQVTATNHDPQRERQLLAETLKPHWRSGRIAFDPQLTATLGFESTETHRLRGVA